MCFSKKGRKEIETQRREEKKSKGELGARGVTLTKESAPTKHRPLGSPNDSKKGRCQYIKNGLKKDSDWMLWQKEKSDLGKTPCAFSPSVGKRNARRGGKEESARGGQSFE